MIHEQSTEHSVENGEYQKVTPDDNIESYLGTSTFSTFRHLISKRRIFVDKDSPSIISLSINLLKEQRRMYFSRINSIFRKSSGP